MFENIYKRKLKYPNSLQVDTGREFMGPVTQLMQKQNLNIRRCKRPSLTVGSLNRTPTERLFGYQFAKEFISPHKKIQGMGKRATWCNQNVKRRKKKKKHAKQSPRVLMLVSDVREQEAYSRRRATDPI